MADMKTWTVTEPYLDVDCLLGEGPFYEKQTETLRFVDIKKKQVHVVSVKNGPSNHKVFDINDPVTITADIEGSEKVIVGAKYGYAVFNRETGKHEYIKKVWDNLEDEDKMRFNDGAIDSQGRFWAGSMNDFHVGEPKPEGILFRLDSDLTLHRMLDGITVPNGIGWSLNDTLMYFTDSPTRNIYVFDYEASSGTISNRRVFFHLDSTAEPDGLAVDVEGHVWTALYGDGKVLRLSPEGRVVAEIHIPTSNITCPCFGGPDMDELFITTAAESEPEKKPESARHGGRLYHVKVGVKGQLKNKFKYSAQADLPS